MASENSPNTTAAKANLAAEPLFETEAYSLALSSSSMQPSSPTEKVKSDVSIQVETIILGKPYQEERKIAYPLSDMVLKPSEVIQAPQNPQLQEGLN